MTRNIPDMYREPGSSQTLSYLGTGIAHCEWMLYSWYLYTDRVIVGEKTVGNILSLWVLWLISGKNVLILRIDVDEM